MLKALLYMLLALSSFTSLSYLALISPHTSADTTTVEASVSVPVSCSLSGTGTNSHNADVANGTYQTI